jgi:hypothetical protein
MWTAAQFWLWASIALIAAAPTSAQDHIIDQNSNMSAVMAAFGASSPLNTWKEAPIPWVMPILAVKWLPKFAPKWTCLNHFAHVQSGAFVVAEGCSSPFYSTNENAR